MFWQALKKLAVGLFVLAILVAAGWAGWLYRADVLQVTNNAIKSSADSIHAIRFNRKRLSVGWRSTG